MVENIEPPAEFVNNPMTVEEPVVENTEQPQPQPEIVDAFDGMTTENPVVESNAE